MLASDVGHLRLTVSWLDCRFRPEAVTPESPLMHKYFALVTCAVTVSCAAQATPADSPSESLRSNFASGERVIAELSLECEASGRRQIGRDVAPVEVTPIREPYFIHISESASPKERRTVIKIRAKSLVEETFFSWDVAGETSSAIVDATGWHIVASHEPSRRIRTLDVDRQVGSFKMTRGDFGQDPPMHLSISGPCKRAGPMNPQF